MSSSKDPGSQQWVLQLCHGYDGPFLDCARQYAVLFSGTAYKVCTVYLTGEPSAEAENGSASDEVIFLGYNSKDVRGLKLDAMRRLRGIVAGRNFRFCIAHRFKPIYVALLATRLPVIGVHHAFGIYSRKMRRWFVNCFRSRLLLLGVSNAVRDDIRQRLRSWPSERIETLYNRIDLAAVQAEQVDREAARAHLGLPQNAWVVGNVGRLHPDKDQATLILGFARALPDLPQDSLLVIMGQGRLEGELRQLAQSLGIGDAVRFLGQVANGRRYFKAFDVFALTSDCEPFGMVLLEAMAAGVPVIATACGGAPEVIGESGSLFPLGGHASLADYIRESASATSSERGNVTVRQAQRMAELFSDQAAGQQFWQLMSRWHR
jgi:glycosyltransferase involved in cell wall biosynthesis